MNKKFFAFCFLLPLTLSGCSKPQVDNTDYLTTEEALTMVDSIAQYRQEHFSEFKFHNKFTFEISEDVSVSVQVGVERQTISLGIASATYYGDSSKGIYEFDMEGEVLLGTEFETEVDEKEYWFTEGGRGYYANYVNQDDKTTKEYWEYNKEDYETNLHHFLFDDIVESVFDPDLNALKQFIQGDTSYLLILDQYPSLFLTSSITSTGPGCLDVDIRGFARRSTKQRDQFGDNIFEARQVIENYVTTYQRYCAVKSLSGYVDDDDVSGVASGTARAIVEFAYKKGCDKNLVKPDLSEYQKQN